MSFRHVLAAHPMRRWAGGGVCVGAALFAGSVAMSSPDSGAAPAETGAPSGPPPASAPPYSVAWTFDTGGAIYSAPAEADGIVYIGSGDGHVYAVDATTGQERWRAATGGAADAAPAVADGVVYVLNRAGVLHALDTADGRSVWTFHTGGEERLDFWDFYLSDPLVHRDLVIFGSGDGHVYAVDRVSGRERWRFLTEGLVHAAPVADSVFVYAAGFDGALYALRLADGELSWVFRTEGNPSFPRGELQRGAALHSGVLYVGSRDYHLYAVDAASGEMLWRIREGTGWIVATPLVEADRLYFGASDGQRFYAADSRDGTVLWSVPLQTRVFGSAVRAGELLLVGGFNGRLVALDPQDGGIRWMFETEASRRNYGSVYEGDGTLNDEMRELYRSGRGRVAEGRILSLGSIAATPLVSGHHVYFGTTEGLLYALRLSSQ